MGGQSQYKWTSRRLVFSSLSAPKLEYGLDHFDHYHTRTVSGRKIGSPLCHFRACFMRDKPNTTTAQQPAARRKVLSSKVKSKRPAPFARPPLLVSLLVTQPPARRPFRPRVGAAGSLARWPKSKRLHRMIECERRAARRPLGQQRAALASWLSFKSTVISIIDWQADWLGRHCFRAPKWQV